METNLKQISNFVDRYKDFTKRLERQKIIHYKTKFDGLLTGYESLRSIIDTVERKESSQYNIFNILNINTAEVKTHTPFLRNLLDPTESHSQKDLFLQSFINEFVPVHKKDNFRLDQIEDYHVIEEKQIYNGRIDIYITSSNPNSRFGIVIENKIYASDQYLQLSRYHEYLKRRKFEDEQIMIFYLTVDGTDPSAHSIDQALLSELTRKNILKTISYRKDIHKWLNCVIFQIQSDKIRHSIKQYLTTISNL